MMGVCLDSFDFAVGAGVSSTALEEEPYGGVLLDYGSHTGHCQDKLSAKDTTTLEAAVECVCVYKYICIIYIYILLFIYVHYMMRVAVQLASSFSLPFINHLGFDVRPHRWCIWKRLKALTAASWNICRTTSR